MISFNINDGHMATRASEVMQDLYLEGEGDFTRDDYDSAKKLGQLRRGLLVTGDEQTQVESEALLKEVVAAELERWVPDASQRLINRASGALGFAGLLDPVLAADHGDNPRDHALSQDWVCGIFVLRCVTCARLFKV